jgi:hypothetical protein
MMDPCPTYSLGYETSIKNFKNTIERPGRGVPAMRRSKFKRPSEFLKTLNPMPTPRPIKDVLTPTPRKTGQCVGQSAEDKNPQTADGSEFRRVR